MSIHITRNTYYTEIHFSENSQNISFYLGFIGIFFNLENHVLSVRD